MDAQLCSAIGTLRQWLVMVAVAALTACGSGGSGSADLDGAPSVQPQAPIFDAPAEQAAVTGRPLSFAVNATDPDGPTPLTLSAQALPAGATFTDEGDGTGQFSWTPPEGAEAGSPYSVTFTATDGYGLMSATSTVIAVELERTISTGFDTVEAGDFTVGEPPTTAAFKESLTGEDSAWLVFSGRTAVVEFATPARMIDFTFEENFPITFETLSLQSQKTARSLLFGSSGRSSTKAGISSPALQKTTCGVTGTGDPAAAYEVPIFVRGDFNDWAEPPAAEAQFHNLGTSVYQAEFNLQAGDVNFKVASADWSTVDLTANGAITLDTPVTLQPGAGLGNTTISIAASGCYNFALDVTDTAAPVLTVTEVPLAAPTTGSSARIYDAAGQLLFAYTGGESVRVVVDRVDGQTLIGRVEIQNFNDPDSPNFLDEIVGVTEFSWKARPADAPATSVRLDYTRPDGVYDDTTVVFTSPALPDGSVTVVCAALSSAVNSGCSASIEVPFGTQVSYVVRNAGVDEPGSAGSTTASEPGGTQTAYAFAAESLLHVPSPQWSDQIIYFLMTDRFANAETANDCFDGIECRPEVEAGYSGGDLLGIAGKVDYIKGLGATAVWITPPVANQWWDGFYGGYHGYWARDFKAIDEHYGTLNDYRLLADTLHRNDMYLIQDVVVNHTGNFGFYFNNQFDPQDKEVNYIPNLDSVPVSQPTQSPFDMSDPRNADDLAADIFHFTPQITDFGDRFQELTWELANLDDLKTENPVVRKALRDAFGYWIREIGVDGFRVDTVKFVEHEFYVDWMNSTDPDAPGINSVAADTGRDDFLAFGEVFEVSQPFDDAGERKVSSYLGEPEAPQLPALIQFPLWAEIGRVIAQGAPVSQMQYRLERFMDPTLFADPYITPTFIDNHDVARFLSGGSREALKQALMFIMSIPGVPVIYMGTEQEFLVTRQAMFAAGYNSSNRDWYDTSSDMYQTISELASVRKGNKVLTRGDLTVLGANPHGAGELSYRRHYASENSTAFAFLNTSEQNIIVSGVETGLAPGTVLELIAGLVGGSETAVLADGTVTLQLAPREGLIYLAGSVGEVPVPTVDIQLLTDVDGQSFDNDFVVSGTVTPVLPSLKLVLDGYLDDAATVPVNPDGTWSATVQVTLLPVNDIPHRLVVFDPVSQSGSPTASFVSTYVPPVATTGVDDPLDDDRGPTGSYVYPTDPSFDDLQGDIQRTDVRAAGRDLELTFTMGSINTSFGSDTAGNGFDHVSFHIFFDTGAGGTETNALPETGGGTAPTDFNWEAWHRVYGFGQAAYSAVGATTTNRGTPIAAIPTITVDKAARKVTFKYDAVNFGLVNWTGVKLYVFTWDIDGIGDQLRPLEANPGPFIYGGRQNASDPLVLDDIAVITVPAP